MDLLGLLQDVEEITGCTAEQLEIIERVSGILEEKSVPHTTGDASADSSVTTVGKTKYNGLNLSYEWYENDTGVQELMLFVKAGKKHLFAAIIEFDLETGTVEVKKDLLNNFAALDNFKSI